MQPRISIVLPTYQCAPYIRQAIESVLAQRYPPECLEIIVVDDGSTDNTAQLLRPYLQRIRYIFQDNRGVAVARNTGIAAAQGDFIAFLDADDYWLPDRLSAMVEGLNGATDRLVTTDFLISIDGQVSDTAYYHGRALERTFDLEPAEQLKAALEDNFISYMMMMPRRVLAEVGTFDVSLHYGEDWDLWLRCLSAGYRMQLIPQALAVYRYLRPGSSTTRNDFAKGKDRIRVLTRHREQVSGRRLKIASGAMHHAAVRELWASREYRAASFHLFSVLFNPTYMQRVLQRRVAALAKDRTKPADDL